MQATLSAPSPLAKLAGKIKPSAKRDLAPTRYRFAKWRAPGG